MKKALLFIGISGWLVVAQLNAQDSGSLVVADFEKDFSGFSGGKISRVEGDAKDGKGALKFEADFSKQMPHPWSTTQVLLDVGNEIRSLSFWVKTADVKQLTVRLVDSTGQSLQVIAPLAGVDDWQEVKIASFEGGRSFQAFGGAGDKKVHWPAKAVAIIMEKTGLREGKSAGTVLLDQVVVETVGQPKSLVPSLEELAKSCDVVKLDDFEGEGGFYGNDLTRDSVSPHGGANYGRLDGSFAQADAHSAWTVAKKDLDIAKEIKALRFWVRSKEAKQLTVCLIDSTGQSLQQRPGFANDGQWHEIVLRGFESGAGFQSFGGADDKKVHWPAKQLVFILEKNGLEGDSGSLGFDDVDVFVQK